MINRIKQTLDLQKFISEDCCENGVCVSFDDKVDRQNIIILKVDQFYNSLKLADTPPSPDCLIIRSCIKGGGYGLTIVELKSITSSKGFELSNLKGKFETCFRDFIETKFPHIFDIDYKEIKLFFVSKIEVHKRDMGLKMDVLINTRFRFRGKEIMIRPHMPSPTIKNCY